MNLKVEVVFEEDVDLERIQEWERQFCDIGNFEWNKTWNFKKPGIKCNVRKITYYLYKNQVAVIRVNCRETETIRRIRLECTIYL